MEKVEDAINNKKSLFCIGYNLSQVDLSEKKFEAPVYFSKAIFHEGADFDGAEFSYADFTGAKFSSKANFFRAKFSYADFSWAKFSKALFNYTTFLDAVSFVRSDFFYPTYQ